MTNATASRYATAKDFNNWEERASQMTDAQLLYAIKDCSLCVRSFREFDPLAEGFYLDQLSTYQHELSKRR